MAAHVRRLVKFADHNRGAFGNGSEELGHQICHMGRQPATGVSRISFDQGNVHDRHGMTFAVVKRDNYDNLSLKQLTTPLKWNTPFTGMLS